MGEKIKNRHRLKSKQIRQVVQELKNNFEFDSFDEKSAVETGEYEGLKIIFVDNQPFFMYYKNEIFFTLQGIEKFRPKNRFVIVDMGAVKFVANGADTMAPGVVDADKNILENDQVWICDQKNKKALAVGIATMNGEQMIFEKKGKAVQAVHWVGDKVWNIPAKSI